jgi:Protein of unknown function (DUF3592)
MSEAGLVGQWSATQYWPGATTTSRVKDVPVSFLEGRLATVVRVLLVVGAFLALWRWSSLSWHARGLILTAYGAVLLLVVLLSVLRLRVRARGTVVGVEQRTGRANDRRVTYFHPRVRFTTPDGRTVVFTSAIGSTSKPDVGASRRVRYRLADPEQAEIVSAATWVGAGVAPLRAVATLVLTLAVNAAVRPLVSPPAASRGTRWHGQAAGRRLVQAVVASSATSASDSTRS